MLRPVRGPRAAPPLLERAHEADRDLPVDCARDPAALPQRHVLGNALLRQDQGERAGFPRTHTDL